ncbi:MAG: family 20 glycosylhydrolase [Aliidongia sp.]
MAARHDRLLAAGKPAEAEAHLLHDRDDQSHYESVQAWHDNVVCIGRESCYRFIETVVGDLAHAYRQAGLTLKTLHIGGDEVPDGVWENSPACRRFMAEQGLSTIPELQEYFFTRLGRILSRMVSPCRLGAGRARQIGRQGSGRCLPRSAPASPLYVWRNLWESAVSGRRRTDGQCRLSSDPVQTVPVFILIWRMRKRRRNRCLLGWFHKATQGIRFPRF